MIEIIPAIDLIDGKCVRLVQGDYEQKTTYNDDPVAMAQWFEQAGFKRLHLVDLDGAKAGAIKNIAVLKQIAAATGLVIDFSGGIRTINSCEAALAAGAAIISIGSMAVTQPEMLQQWMQQLGAHRFLIGADVSSGVIAINGWQKKTDISIFKFVEGYMDKGIQRFFCTDVSKDGMMQGPATALYQSLLAKFPEMELTVSGGVASIADIKELERIGCKSVIVGKAIYEGTIKPEMLC